MFLVSTSVDGVLYEEVVTVVDLRAEAGEIDT